MKQHINAVVKGYSEVFFLKHYGIGILILAVTLIHPNVAVAGVVSVVAACLFARLINLDRDYLSLGLYTYNPLLVGFSIGYLFRLTPLAILFLIVGGVFSLMVTIVMYNIFYTYFRLPVLSLPFVVVSTMVYLASAKYANLLVNDGHPVDQLASYLPLWLSGYFKSLGAIFFVPQVAAGLIFALSILAASRILFLLSVVGYYTSAAFTALMAGSLAQAFADTNHLNGMLLAMAVGAIFLIPSLRSYFLALIAVCASAVVQDSVLMFWFYATIPGFTLPFNVVLLTFVYALGLINYPQLPKVVKSTPEETLDFYLANRRHHLGSDKTLMLPFLGKWTVWQGFDGQWTHQGLWRYGYDFLITDENGSSHRNEDNNLHDYYAYRKPVLAPVCGRVVKVVEYLPDNPIGQVDEVNNWGNLVIIYDERGFYVEISHFAQDSIQVEEGALVERGAVLGLCGNSGFSSQPHIHVQVQLTAAVGAYTVPFSFVSYANDNTFHANELPAEGATVEALRSDRNLELKTSFAPDDVYQYEVWEDGRRVDDLTLTIKTLPDGTLYFDSGKGKLYMGKHEGTFRFYSVEGHDPHLEAMMLALPCLPLARRANLQWGGQVPIGLASKGFRKAAVQFINSFYHDFAAANVVLTCRHRNRIEGTIRSPPLKLEKKTLVEWDNQPGFKTIQVDDIELRRVTASSPSSHK